MFNKTLTILLKSLKYIVHMKLLAVILFLVPMLSSAQTNDVFVLLKNGENVKMFSTGMPLTMETIYDQWFEGTITAIRHDSVFINGTPFHYKEFKTLKWQRSNFNYTAFGSGLIVAGVGVLVLGAVNGAYRGDKASEWYAPTSFITAGAFILTGLILLKSKYKIYHLGKKFSIQYMDLSSNKNNQRPF